MLFLILLLFAGATDSYITDCKKCVIVDNCPELSKIFRRKPYSGQNLRFYTTVACGFSLFTPKVCCEEKLINSIANWNELERLNEDLGDFKHDVLNEFCDIEKEAKRSKIVGGITASIGLFPWMAKLGYIDKSVSNKENDVTYRCGGSLITRKHVLTAGHCIVRLPPNMNLSVVLLDADGYPQKRRPLQLYPHPNFDSPPSYNDLGIIKLDRPAKITDHVKPACVPFGRTSVTLSELLPRTLMVAGWGSPTPGSVIFSPRLRYTRLSYLPHKECRDIFLKGFNLTLGDGHLCTVPDKERDACSGDSGGPLFIWAGDGSSAQGIVLGVVSFGGKICASANVPGVYTKIEQYTEWIRKTVML